MLCNIGKVTKMLFSFQCLKNQPCSVCFMLNGQIHDHNNISFILLWYISMSCLAACCLSSYAVCIKPALLACQSLILYSFDLHFQGYHQMVLAPTCFWYASLALVSKATSQLIIISWQVAPSSPAIWECFSESHSSFPLWKRNLYLQCIIWLLVLCDFCSACQRCWVLFRQVVKLLIKLACIVQSILLIINSKGPQWLDLSYAQHRFDELVLTVPQVCRVCNISTAPRLDNMPIARNKFFAAKGIHVVIWQLIWLGWDQLTLCWVLAFFSPEW